VNRLFPVANNPINHERLRLQSDYRWLIWVEIWRFKEKIWPSLKQKAGVESGSKLCWCCRLLDFFTPYLAIENIVKNLDLTAVDFNSIDTQNVQLDDIREKVLDTLAMLEIAQ
jgi:hypothetical protein